jgi:hypothetical protein
LSIGKNSVPSLNTRVFLSPQEVVQAVQTLSFLEEVFECSLPSDVVCFFSYWPGVGDPQANKMNVFVADAKRVVWVLMVLAWVVRISHCLGCTEAKGWGRGDAGGLDLFPGVSERVNSVRGRGVVGNSKCVQVNGNK